MQQGVAKRGIRVKNLRGKKTFHSWGEKATSEREKCKKIPNTDLAKDGREGSKVAIFEAAA